jgi:LEA14-like dessication related protein
MHVRFPRSAAFLALVTACATTPPPAPTPVAPPPAPKVAEPALALTGLTGEGETLLGLALKLEGALAAGETARELTWKATIGEHQIGSGTVPLAGPGRFEVSLPVTFGATAADLAPFQDGETQQVLVEAAIAKGEATVTETRSVRVRSPKLPSVRIVNVQASRPDPQVLELTFLMSIVNPNPWEIRVGKVTYTATLADKTLIRSDLPLGAKVPASSENTFEIPAEANAQNCGKDIVPMLKKGTLPWGFTGALTVGGLELPIDLQGETKVSAQ